MTSDAVAKRAGDVRAARLLYPATEQWAYFNTAAVGLASRSVADAYEAFVSEWMTDGLDFVRGEASAENARSSVAALMGADRADIALIPSVSAAAGLVAAQFGQASGPENVVIGEQEYSSNHFPWRQLTSKGYEVRQVPFRNGGLEPEALARHVDAGTRLVAFSGVQSATGHRSDIAAISALARGVGAMVFVDASQMLGAMPVRHELDHVDVMAAADHKFLLHAGRGLGYCYLSPRVRDDFIPINAGWKGGPSHSRASSARGWSCRRPRRGSTTRSAGWRRWETRPHSRPSTNSARTRSTEGTPSSRPFSDQPSAMRVGRR